MLRGHNIAYWVYLSLVMGVTALVASALLAGLVLLRVVPVDWDAQFLPRIVLWGLVPCSVLSLLVSGVGWLRHHSTRAVIALVVGVLATAASLFAFLIVIATAAGGHPL